LPPAPFLYEFARDIHNILTDGNAAQPRALIENRVAEVKMGHLSVSRSSRVKVVARRR